MKISIIILSWNTKELLRQCLKSLISNFQFPISNYEVIVVDNGSTDGSVQEIKNLKLKMQNYKLKFKIILNRTNLGFAKGNNQGIRAATGDLIMVLNSDTVVGKGAIEKLALQLIKSPKTAAVSPLLLFKSGRPQIDYYMKFPNLWQIFLYHNPVLRALVLKIPLLRNKIMDAHLRGVLGSHLGMSRVKSVVVDQLPGAALMAPREVWREVGLLDEDYQFLYEDVDWCWRAKKLGYKLIVVPDAKIVHIGGASWKKKLQQNSFEFYQQYFSSMLLFVKKNYGERKFKIFRAALVFHFLITLKFKLAWWFLINTLGKQERLWE